MNVGNFVMIESSFQINIESSPFCIDLASSGKILAGIPVVKYMIHRRSLKMAEDLMREINTKEETKD